MTQTPHTKVTQPQEDPRGDGAVIDGECYIKSTVKTSTWEVSSHKTSGSVCPAADNGPNVVQFDNVDWEVSGMYAGYTGHKRPYKMLQSGYFKGHDILPQGEDSYRALVDWSINKNMTIGIDPQTEADKWKFKYVDGNDDKTFPYSATIKPKWGQMNQYVIKFKEPVDVPARTAVHWWWNHQNSFTAHGPGGKTGYNKQPHNYGNDMRPGGAGGFFTEPNINKLPVDYANWSGSKCGDLAYFKNPGIDWKNKGLQGVYWMITPGLITGCGPTFVSAPHLGPAHFRQVALGFTGFPDILTEGIDWK